MREYLFIMVVAAAVTYLTTPLVRRIARRIGAITPVRDRDVHSVPIPRMGGTAMLLGFCVAFVTAGQMPFLSHVFQNGRTAYGVLLGAVAVCALGVADDLWGLDALTKLAGQALAAGLMAWQGIELAYLPAGGVTIFSPGVVLLFTMVAVVVTINAVNFIDGLDGLAAGVVGIAGMAFFVYSYLLSRDISDKSGLGDYSSLASLITAATVGCCLGFLPHNFNPARIFMGDSGSMLLGLLLASSTIAITGQIDPTLVSNNTAIPAFFPLVLPLAVIALPLADMVLAVVRRTRAGRMPWTPDAKHLHHRMLALGHSHVRAVLILYLWTATVAFGVASVAFLRPWTAVALGVVAVLASTLLTLGPLRGGRRRRGAARRRRRGGPPVAQGDGNERRTVSV
jgi:UDP-GlcNAc:undecaprenyl-phosphate GlcNAc-1-phosphate transferase